MELNVDLLRKHGSDVLTVLGCAGVLTTAYFASEEYSRAAQAVKDKKPVNVYEHLMAVIPKRKKTIISAGFTIACILGAHSIDKHNLAKIAGSCAAIGGAFSRYKDTAKRYLGDDRFKELDDRFKEDEEEIRNDDEVKHWFYEPITGRCFQSSWKDMWQAIDDAHKILTLEGGLKFNDFLYFLGFGENCCKDFEPLSKTTGWDSGDLICQYDYPWVDIRFDKVNDPECGKVDYNFNDGRITYEMVYCVPPEEMGIYTNLR